MNGHPIPSPVPDLEWREELLDCGVRLRYRVSHGEALMFEAYDHGGAGDAGWRLFAGTIRKDGRCSAGATDLSGERREDLERLGAVFGRLYDVAEEALK